MAEEALSPPVPHVQRLLQAARHHRPGSDETDGQKAGAHGHRAGDAAAACAPAGPAAASAGGSAQPAAAHASFVGEFTIASTFQGITPATQFPELLQLATPCLTIFLFVSSPQIQPPPKDVHIEEWPRPSATCMANQRVLRTVDIRSSKEFSVVHLKYLLYFNS